MRAAFENALVAPGLCKHCPRRRDMVLLAGMRGAGERDLLCAQAQAVRGAALEQRQGLQRLDRGARVDRPLDVAERHHDRSARVDDRSGAAMGGFDPIAAQSLGDHGIAHLRLLESAANRRMGKPAPQS